VSSRDADTSVLVPDMDRFFSFRPIAKLLPTRQDERPEGLGGEVESIRVLLVGLPRMLRDIVNGLVSVEPDLEIVGEFGDGEAELDAIEAARASVVIAGAQAPLLARRLVDRVRVLGVSADGRDGVVYELRPQARVLGEMSPATLLAAVRGEDLSEPRDHDDSRPRRSASQ
jgi:hypothetical protein